MNKWYDDHENLTGLARWLDNVVGYWVEASEVIYYMEKPWKWNNEFELWLLWQDAIPARQEQIREAVIEERTVEDLKAEWEEFDESK